MKKIFILLIICFASITAQTKFYVLHDAHHDDYYKGGGSWTRYENQALHYGNLQEAKRVAQFLRYDQNDGYSDPAPVFVEQARIKVDWDKLKTDLREILNEAAEHTDSIIFDMNKASDRASRKARADSIYDAEFIRIMLELKRIN